MSESIKTSISSLILATVFFATPHAVSAYVDYGTYYQTPAPHSQLYYQPMYAYASSPVLNHQMSAPQQNQYFYNSYPPQQNYYPQQQYSQYGQYAQPYSQQWYQPQQYSYNQYPQYNSYPSYGQSWNPSQPNYANAPYGQGVNMYGQNVPYSYGYPTGETVPLIGGQLCEFPDYNGRALCGSNPNQYIYDPWTGSWY